MVYNRCTEVAFESWLRSVLQDACPEVVLWSTVYLVIVEDAALVSGECKSLDFRVVFVISSKHDKVILFFKRRSFCRAYRRTQVQRSIAFQRQELHVSMQPKRRKRWLILLLFTVVRCCS